MKLGYDMQIKQEQKIVLSQKMKQSISILQMPLYDLREFIYNEFSENPVLDVSDHAFKAEKNTSKELDYEKYLSDSSNDNLDTWYKKEEDTSPLNYIEKKKSLKEYLYEQLLGMDEKQEVINIAKYIIESLDTRGYLGVPVDELKSELHVSRKMIEKGLKVVQSLEPYGIGAENVKQCLMIQSKNLNILDEIVEKMINNHLEDIAKNKYDEIAKKLNISKREAQRYGDLIRNLEPKPSRGFFTGDEVNFIIPDAEIKQVNNEFFIIMNDSALPKLTINNTYKKALRSMDDNTNKYVKDKIDQALFLIKSIEQRKNTLFKVLECLLRKQKDFFCKGKEYMKPLTLKEVAIDIKYHESTISRTIRDKYVLTSYGTIKIKDFFQNGIKLNKNEEIANTSIKNQIKSIIDSEDKKHPLSDECISILLKNKSIKISRRTIAKYRTELGIKSSNLRKRL